MAIHGYQVRLIVWNIIFAQLFSYAVSTRADDAVYYEKNRKRTNWLVKDGSLTFSSGEVEFMTDLSKDTITFQIDYTLVPVIGLTTKKSETVTIHNIYLQPEFLSELDAKRIIETEHFRAELVGREDRKNKDGTTYKNCRILKFSKIKYLALPVEEHGKSVLSKIESLVVTVAKPDSGIPLLGVAQFDFEGYLNHMPFKVGADYLPDGPKK